MQSNLIKNIQKIFTAFNKIGRLPKNIIKYGSLAFLGLFAVGTALIAYNHLGPEFDSYFEFSATTLIKNSFIILAESVVGGLIIDFVLRKE